MAKLFGTVVIWKVVEIETKWALWSWKSIEDRSSGMLKSCKNNKFWNFQENYVKQIILSVCNNEKAVQTEKVAKLTSQKSMSLL